MNERLGIVEERQANRLKYASKRYIAPQDRILPPSPKVKDEHPVVEAAAVAKEHSKLRRPYIRIPNTMRRALYGGPIIHDRAVMTEKARDVIRVFSEVYGVDATSVLTPARSRKFARPRQSAMYAMAKHLKLSQPTIGKIFSRDASTVTYAISRKVPVLLVEDLGFASRYYYGMQKLRSLWAVQ